MPLAIQQKLETNNALLKKEFVKIFHIFMENKRYFKSSQLNAIYDESFDVKEKFIEFTMKENKAKKEKEHNESMKDAIEFEKQAGIHQKKEELKSLAL